MVAVAERPQRFNYGMTSNHLDLDLEEAEGPAVSDCKSYKGKTACELRGSRCEWSTKCKSRCNGKNKSQCIQFPQCEWFERNKKSKYCVERTGCRLSIQTWYKGGRGATTTTPHYQAHEELPDCLRALGFRAFPQGYGETPFVVKDKETCKPKKLWISNRSNPLDCIAESGYVVTLEVVQPDVWESTDGDILKCTWYTEMPYDESFSQHCLDGNGDNPNGVDPQTGKTRTMHEKQGTTSWTPILFVRFEDSLTLPALNPYREPWTP